MLKIGIVGAGVMGNRHEGRVADYGAQVVAVHDIHLPAAQELGTRAGAKIVTDDLERFFEAEMDGLIITTPPPVRVEPVRRACERGVHLMIEKPPALNMADGRACLAHIEDAGVINAVSFQLRYGSIYERLKELLADETVHLVHTVCTVEYYLKLSDVTVVLAAPNQRRSPRRASNPYPRLCPLCHGERQAGSGTRNRCQEYGTGSNRV